MTWPALFYPLYTYIISGYEPIAFIWTAYEYQMGTSRRQRPSITPRTGNFVRFPPTTLFPPRAVITANQINKKVVITWVPIRILAAIYKISCKVSKVYNPLKKKKIKIEVLASKVFFAISLLSSLPLIDQTMKIDSDFLPEKQCIVIDIGTKYTKFGFATEHSPRCIIRTCCEVDGELIPDIYKYKDQQKLTLALSNFIHTLFYKHALVAPKDKKVIIVESLLSPTKFKEILAKVLFITFEVASLCFVPSHCAALYTLGISTALVFDVGYKEAILIPVCEGVPVLRLWQAMPLGGEAVENLIKTRISIGQLSPDESLDGIAEDIKVRSCFVTTLKRSQLLTTGQSVEPKTTNVEYHINGERSVTISGDVRETVHDVLFEENIDEMSITTMILETINNTNMDMRLKFAENIVLMGGTVMVKGFIARLKEELLEKLKTPKYKNLKVTKFKFHVAPAYENYIAWLGGSIFGSTNNLNILSQTRDNYISENYVPDWPTTFTRRQVE